MYQVLIIACIAPVLRRQVCGPGRQGAGFSCTSPTTNTLGEPKSPVFLGKTGERGSLETAHTASLTHSNKFSSRVRLMCSPPKSVLHHPVTRSLGFPHVFNDYRIFRATRVQDGPGRTFDAC